MVEFAMVLLIASGVGLIVYVVITRISPRLAFGQSSISLVAALPHRTGDVIDGLFGLVTLIFGVVFVAICLRRYETLSFFGDDFLFFDQAIWNSLRGRLMENTAYLDSPTLLGHHFSPILLAFVPLYVFGDGRPILAILPALALTLSAFPLYWFARKQVGRVVALIIVSVFFLSPGVQYLGTYQFYEVILVVPLLMFAMFFLTRDRSSAFLVCLGLSLLVKEEIAITTIGFGIFLALCQRKIVPGLLLSSAALVWILVLLLWVLPAIQGGTNYFFFGGSPERPGLSLYGYLGKNLGEIVMTMITRPDLILQHVMIEPKIEAIALWVMPLGAIALIGIEITALALPTFAYVLLAAQPWVYSPGSYHYAPVAPFLFFGMVIGVRRIISWLSGKSSASINSRTRRLVVPAAVGICVLVLGGLSSYVYNQQQPFAILDFNRYPVTEHTRRAEPIAQMIPSDAVILAQTELMPLISERKYAYIMPAIPCLGMADYVFADRQRPWYGYRKDIWADILQQPLFEPVLDEDGYILKRRRPPAHSLDANFADRITLLGYTFDLTGNLQGGLTFRPVLTWRIDRAMLRQYTRIARVTDAQGHLWAMDEGTPGGGDCTTERLAEGMLLSDQLRLDLPPTMPRGRYWLSVEWYDKASSENLTVLGELKNVVQTEVFLTALEVEKNKASFTASQLRIEQPLFVDMGEMRFLGSTFLPGPIRHGEEISIGLYWRARGKPRGDYLVVVQLRDVAGRVLAEQEARPAAGTYPTTQWVEGEVLLDWHDFVVPATLEPGEYTVEVVLRNAASGAVLGEVGLGQVPVVVR